MLLISHLILSLEIKWLGKVISALLLLSPARSDYIFIANINLQSLACSLYGLSLFRGCLGIVSYHTFNEMFTDIARFY